MENGKIQNNSINHQLHLLLQTKQTTIDILIQATIDDKLMDKFIICSNIQKWMKEKTP